MGSADATPSVSLMLDVQLVAWSIYWPIGTFAGQ